MRSSATLPFLMALALCACTSPAAAPAPGTPSNSPGTGGATGGSGPSATGGSVSTPVADAAPSSTGGAPAPNPPGPDASSSGSAAEVGTPPDVGAGAPFTCNLLVGPSPMMQWFEGGFLMHAGIDPTRWELISVAHHYTDAWARPGDSAWNMGFDKGHACAQGAMTPDRVIFQATQWSHTTAEQWEADFMGIVQNIKTKWPSVKRIELMASTSAPSNKPCPAANGKNNETIVPEIGYQAIDAMPAKFPGLVFALPHFEVQCSDYIGNGTAPQYAPNANATSGPAVMDVANVFATYFSQHL
jgi:hypothetical protein